jgi:hypothetical protein
MDSEEKVCYRCQKTKPLSAFIQRIDDTYYNMCRACVSEILAQKPSRKAEGSSLEEVADKMGMEADENGILQPLPPFDTWRRASKRGRALKCRLASGTFWIAGPANGG